MSTYLNSKYANLLAKESGYSIYELPHTVRLYDLPDHIYNEEASVDIKIKKLCRLWKDYNDLTLTGNGDGYCLGSCEIKVSCDDDGFPVVWLCKKYSCLKSYYHYKTKKKSSDKIPPDYDFLAKISQAISHLFEKQLKETWTGDCWYLNLFEDDPASAFEYDFKRFQKSEIFRPRITWQCFSSWLTAIGKYNPEKHKDRLLKGFDQLMSRSEELWKDEVGEHQAEYDALWCQKKVEVLEKPHTVGLFLAMVQPWSILNPFPRPTGQMMKQTVEVALSYVKLFSRFAASTSEYDLSPKSIKYGMDESGIRQIFLRRLREAKEPDIGVAQWIEWTVKLLQQEIQQELKFNWSDLPLEAFQKFDSLCDNLLAQSQVSPLSLDDIEDKLKEILQECQRLEGLNIVESDAPNNNEN